MDHRFAMFQRCQKISDKHEKTDKTISENIIDAENNYENKINTPKTTTVTNSPKTPTNDNSEIHENLNINNHNLDLSSSSSESDFSDTSSDSTEINDSLLIFECLIEHCELKFQTEYHRMIHTAEVHLVLPKNPFVCQICKHACIYKGGFESHMRETHSVLDFVAEYPQHQEIKEQFVPVISDPNMYEKLTRENTVIYVSDTSLETTANTSIKSSESHTNIEKARKEPIYLLPENLLEPDLPEKNDNEPVLACNICREEINVFKSSERVLFDEVFLICELCCRNGEVQCPKCGAAVKAKERVTARHQCKMNADIFDILSENMVKKPRKKRMKRDDLKEEIVKSEKVEEPRVKTKMKQEATESKKMFGRKNLKNQIAARSDTGIELITVKNQENKGETTKNEKMKPTKIKFDNKSKKIGSVKSSWYDIMDIEKVKTGRNVLRKKAPVLLNRKQNFYQRFSEDKGVDKIDTIGGRPIKKAVTKRTKVKTE